MIITCKMCNSALPLDCRYYYEAGKICEYCYDIRTQLTHD